MNKTYVEEISLQYIAVPVRGEDDANGLASRLRYDIFQLATFRVQRYKGRTGCWVLRYGLHLGTP
jgi:hypothetical protein